MRPSEKQTAGWSGSIRRIGTGLLELIRCRFKLFTTELQEEKLRLIHLLLWLAVALTLGVAGLLIGLGALIIWVWMAAGYLGLIALALAALAVAAGIVLAIRRRIKTDPPPFSATAGEFKKDIECLRRD